METKQQTKPVPEAEKHWLFGSTYYFFKDAYGFCLGNSRKFESIYKVSNPIRHVYVSHDPDIIKHILQDNNKNYHKSFGYEILKLLLGNGLLTSEDDFWRKQRRLAQPAFHKQRLANLNDLMLGFSLELAENIEKQGKSDFNIAPEMMEVALKIVSKSLFGSDIDNLVDKVSDNLDIVLEAAMKRIRNPLYPPTWFPTPSNFVEKKGMNGLIEVVTGIISKRRNESAQKDDLLAMLMEAKDEETGEQMSDQQLLDECMTIFLAGHETTAVGMSWMIYCLTQNPEVTDKLCTEIDLVLEGRNPTIEDLRKLTYTRMVVDELLRLYPPAWIIGRKSLNADIVKGYELPADTNILFPTFAVQRDPRWWDEPEKFIPERFSKENNSKRHKYVYFPFGGGPRLCIGNNFALMEMQIITVVLMQRFKFNLKDGFEPELDPLITLRPKTGMWVNVEKRN